MTVYVLMRENMFRLEAMAAGVPVVRPRRGAFVEVVEQTHGGLLVRWQLIHYWGRLKALSSDVQPVQDRLRSALTTAAPQNLSNGDGHAFL